MEETAPAAPAHHPLTRRVTIPDACAWPALAEPYASALREAVAYTFERWTPMGIVAGGTIVRGTPSASSDLDLYVIHREPVRQRVQRRFNGVPAELFVNPPDRIERYFESDRHEGRLVSAHIMATGFVVYEADPIVERLRTKAAAALGRRPEPSEASLNHHRYVAATWLEDAEDVADGDPALCAMLLHRAVVAAVTCRFWLGHLWQPRSKDTLLALTDVDPQLASSVRDFYGATELAARRALARTIVREVTGETGFFEWESDPERL